MPSQPPLSHSKRMVFSGKTSRLHKIFLGIVILMIVTVLIVSFLIVACQGVAQGVITLTIVSSGVGITIGILTLIVNYFQWLSVAPRGDVNYLQGNLLRSSQDRIATSEFSHLPNIRSRAETLAHLTSDTEIEHLDWSEAPRIEHFNGREQELTRLKKWIVTDHCQIIAICGIGGIGKTTLSTVLVQQLSKEFDFVFWRSLQNAPLLENVVKSCVLLLSHQQEGILPQENDSAQIDVLIDYLRRFRCLLVLDNFESILQDNHHTGYYREQYEGYSKLLERLGETQHRSCLLLTSREKPKGLVRLEGRSQMVRTMQITDIELLAARAILSTEGLSGSDEAWHRFITLYSGNPLVLKLVSESIRELFQGDIAAFLKQGEPIVGDLQELLAQQFERLPTLEQEIMYWLAIEREAVSFDILHEDTRQSELLEALKLLKRCSLIEVYGNGYFTLQPAIMEYITNQLIKYVFKEIRTNTFALLESHALIKALAKDYIRESQRQFLLTPLINLLYTTYGKVESEKKLQYVLTTYSKRTTHAPGHVAGNVLNLLIHSGCDLHGYDFSHLYVRQAYLVGSILKSVNFSDTQLVDCIFTETFGNILSLTSGTSRALLAAGTADGKIEVWQLPNGKLLFSFRGHIDWVRSVAFNHDESLIASGGDDQTVRLWDVHTGQALATLQGHRGRVYAVAFSPNNNIIASGGDDGIIRLWDVDTKQCMQSIQGYEGRIRSIAFSPDGNIIASGGEGQHVYLWSVTRGQCLMVLQGHTDHIHAVAFSHDGRVLASGSNDHSIHLWDAHTGQQIKILQGHSGRICALAFSLDGTILASASGDRTVRLWEVNTGCCLKVLQGHRNRIRSVAFSTDATIIISGGDDQSVRLWDAHSGQCFKTLQGHNDSIYTVAFSPDDSIIVSDCNQSLCLWKNKKDFKILKGHNDTIYTIAFNPNGSIIASGSGDQTVRLWDARTGLCLKTLQGQNGRVRALAFNSQGSMIASGNDNRNICLWEVCTGQLLTTLRGHTDRVQSVAFSSDGKMLASGGQDQLIRLWETSTERCLRTLKGHNGRIWSATFAPGGYILASGGDDQKIRLWEANTGECISILEGHSKRIYVIVFSPQGTLFASGSEDHTVRLWNIHTGECSKILRGHNNRIRDLAFSSNGQTLASASHDGTIKLWNVETGECKQTLRNDRPYECMNITGIQGVTEAQKMTLITLGAIESQI